MERLTKQKETIQGIYEMKFSHILTPFNLVENAKLKNYKYVIFYKGKDGINVEVRCLCDDGDERIFTYEFNPSDYLMRITAKLENDTQHEVVFDRNDEYDRLIAHYKTLEHCV